MQTTVKIVVRTVGQSFGCESILKRGRRVIWTSRVFPFGMRQKAYQAAEEKANGEGWDLAGSGAEVK